MADSEDNRPGECNTLDHDPFAGLTGGLHGLAEAVMLTGPYTEWPDPAIRFVNQEMCSLSGYSATELVGRSVSTVFAVSGSSDTWARTRSNLSTAIPCDAELPAVRKDGSVFDGSYFVFPISDGSGAPVCTVWIHHTEVALARREIARQLQAYEHVHDIVIATDLDGRVTSWNHAARETLGYSANEAVGRHIGFICAEHERQTLIEAFVPPLPVAPRLSRPISCLARDGQTVWLELNVAMLQDSDGAQHGMVACAKDATQHTVSEQELNHQRETLRAILDAAVDAIVISDHSGAILDANPAAETMFGYRHGDLLGRNVRILMPSPHREEHDAYIARYLETREPRVIGRGREATGCRKDGSTFPISLTLSEVDHLGLFAGVIRDASLRVKLQRDILAAADEEHRRIGQDLHDSIQQDLAGVRLLAQALRDSLQTGQPEFARLTTPEEAAASDEVRARRLRNRELATRVVEGIERTLVDVRAISAGLLPIAPDAVGLMDALAKLARNTNELIDISCSFECDPPVDVRDGTVAAQLYRIAQEATTNALKHASPAHIRIVLEADGTEICMRVADDGCGFTPTETTVGFGINSMRYRATMIGAEISWESSGATAGGGTLVTCKVRVDGA